MIFVLRYSQFKEPVISWFTWKNKVKPFAAKFFSPNFYSGFERLSLWGSSIYEWIKIFLEDVYPEKLRSTFCKEPSFPMLWATLWTVKSVISHLTQGGYCLMDLSGYAVKSRLIDCKDESFSKLWLRLCSDDSLTLFQLVFRERLYFVYIAKFRLICCKRVSCSKLRLKRWTIISQIWLHLINMKLTIEWQDWPKEIKSESFERDQFSKTLNNILVCNTRDAFAPRAIQSKENRR